MIYEHEKPELFHYASPYYDPVKAHEYYMKHRKLKGRRSTAVLTDEGKEIWEYTKANIKEEKDAKIEEAKNEQTQKIESARETASATRESISKKLKELNEKLTANAKAKKEAAANAEKSENEKISKENERKLQEISRSQQAKIERLQAQKPPEGASDYEKQKFREKRDREIARIQGEAASDRDKATAASKKARETAATNVKANLEKIDADTKKERESNSESASQQRTECANKLKSAISAAREAYKAAKQGIDANYEEIYQQEYDKIAASYTKPKKGKSSRKSSGKSDTAQKSSSIYKRKSSKIAEIHSKYS